jgi:hypothetical protein
VTQVPVGWQTLFPTGLPSQVDWHVVPGQQLLAAAAAALRLLVVVGLDGMVQLFHFATQAELVMLACKVQGQKSYNPQLHASEQQS